MKLFHNFNKSSGVELATEYFNLVKESDIEFAAGRFESANRIRSQATELFAAFHANGKSPDEVLKVWAPAVQSAPPEN